MLKPDADLEENEILDIIDFAPNTPDEPEQTPVTIIDLERTGRMFDMFLPMADPCPSCGAFNLRVGDYVCWGMCYHCTGLEYVT